MKLQGIDISGFKSFVDPVSTAFADGVTAIVGPNGCGKSNLADAVTWVLGEQSAKSLRGGTMEDVIFNGSESRRPLGMAEVTLTLLTDPAFPEAQEGRITLGRRVFRTGESQYRLNGKTVRLKQIKDLLMDTGLGIRAYSVIEQGRIGMILSGKPQDRRKLIEEAAGITRYKARKRVAEVKLEEATANLLRLDDIVSEIERSLRSLKRQANAARRYQERDGQYRELLRQVLEGRWSRLQGRLRGLESQLGEGTERGAEITAALHRGEAELAQAREELEVLAEDLSRRHRSQAELAATIEGRQEFLKGARQTRQEISERLEKGRAVAGEQGRELEAQRQTQEERRSQAGVLLSERDEARAAVAQDQEEITRSTELLTHTESRLEGLRSQLAVTQGEVSSVRGRLHKEEIEEEKGHDRQGRLREGLETSSRQVEEAAAVLMGCQKKVGELEERLAERGGEHQKLTVSLEETLRGEGQVSERLGELKAELHSVEQRRAVLEELAEADVERRSALREALDAAGLSEVQFLADRLQVPAGWENALDLYLKPIEDAVLVPDGEAALALAQALAPQRSQATLIRPRQTDDGLQSAPLIEDDAIVLPLGEALALPEEIAAALPPAYLVRTSEDAERLAPRHPHCAFISAHRLWTQNGVLHLQGEEAHPGILARSRELAEIAERLPECEAAIFDVSQELHALVAERTRLAAEVHRVDGERAELRQEVAVAQARAQDASNRSQRVVEEHAELRQEETEIGQTLDAVAQRQLELRHALTVAEERHQSLETGVEEVQREFEEARQRREALRTAGAGRKGRLELLEERVESHHNESRRLGRQIEELTFQVERWVEEEKNLASRHGELEVALAQAEAQLQGALERRSVADEETVGEEERLVEKRQGVRKLEEQVELLRGEREEAQGEVQELRVSQASLEQEADHLRAGYLEQFREAIPQTPESSESESDDEALPWAVLPEMEDELARRKAVLERMGPVNVLAAEEYSEQEERHLFLTAQRADVVASVERLRQTIREINQTSSERFAQTFQVVNASFSETFADLFRGGEAEMRLLDEEDVLESGIEIVARPPGKRQQNIMLLSGGEKALTAIALLFALFRTKPSPFCILDEVDAPLDDANILRFVDLLKSMCRETQFLIITHNKLTMEVASTLYGVTMEEKGVSKLVSVALDEIHPREEAATANHVM